MDALAHALWSALIFKTVNLKRSAKEKFNIWFAAFWGVFPDLFAFCVPLAGVGWGLMTRKIHLLGWPYPGLDALETACPGTYQLISNLYQLSHSIFLFAIIFLLVWLIRKKPVWPMLMWGLHIVIDIPTHNGDFPTPFLWPLTDFTIHGFSWHLPIFMILNYAALFILYFIVWKKEKRAATKNKIKPIFQKSPFRKYSKAK